MVLLVFIRDLGSSLMFFGAFLALLYVATNRLSFVTIGLGMFAIGAWFFGRYADRHGRKAALVFSITVMSACSFLVAIMPTREIIS